MRWKLLRRRLSVSAPRMFVRSHLAGAVALADVLVLRNGKGNTEFKGRYELSLTGQLEGKAWSQALAGGPQALQIRQVTRLEGMIDQPARAVIKGCKSG